MFDKDFDKDLITLILRLVVVGWVTFCAVISRLIAKAVGNQQLQKLSNKLFWCFVFFAFARLFAAALDDWLNYSVGIFSNIVNNGFYFLIAYMLLKLYWRLTEKEEIEQADGTSITNPRAVNKKKLSVNIGEMFAEFQKGDRKLQEIAKQVKQL